jgi:hypothetical protein
VIVLSLILLGGLTAGVLLSFEIGHRIGKRHLARIPKSSRRLSGTMEASVFGLMGLLIAFSFYGAASRFEARRHLIVQEADFIRTAYRWLDLLAPQAQAQLREDFRAYLDSRIDLYRKIPGLLGAHHKIPGIEAVGVELAHSTNLQNRLWSNAVTLTRTENPAVQPLVLSSINRMFEITTGQTVALTTHLPAAVWLMLALTVVVSSALAGYSTAGSGVRDWIPIISFVLMLSAAVYVILDYEYPRVGFIRVDPVDQVLVDLLKEMK